ncbi:MAG: dockerin type I domain-containing protein [Pseudomonadota bacterium]
MQTHRSKGRTGEWFSFLFIVLTITVVSTASASTPPCAPAGLVVLTPASTATLVAIEPDLQPSRLELRFQNPTSELLALAAFDDMLLPPGPGLPTGFRGQVWNVQSMGNELTIVAEGSRRAGNPSLFLTPVLSSQPTDFSGSRSCFTLLEDQDLVDSDADGAGDGGALEAQCKETNGNDYAFSVELVEGVDINGLLTVAPFDIDGEIEIEALELLKAQVISEGRISFTGEISADADAVLPEGETLIGSTVLGSYILKMGELSNIATLTATLTADVFVGACGSISAGTRTGVTSTAAATLGIEYDNGAPRIIASTAETDLQVSPPQLDSDVAADVTLYGGAVLRLSLDLAAVGVIPVAGVITEMTARGSARVQVDPVADPWWQVSGRPEVFVDLYPALLTGDLSRFNFDVINPPEQLLFSANNEFPFTLPAANRVNGTRVSGSALRWSRAYLSADDYQTVDTIPTADGGALSLANSAQFGSILRVDYLGNRVWQRRVEGAFVPQSAFELSNADVLIAGTQSGELWLLLLDADGNELWSRNYASAGGDIELATVTGTDGGDLIVGGLFSNTSGTPELSPWAARIDASGPVVWANYFGQMGVDEQILGVTGTADNGLMLVGDTEFTPPGPLLPGANTYTLRLNPDGTVKWSNVWASSTGDRLLAATQAPDGSFIAVGSTGGTNQDAAPRGLVIRYDEDQAASPVEPRYVRAFGGAFTYLEFVFDEWVDVVNSGDGFALVGTSGLGADRKVWLASLAERGDEPDLTWTAYHDGLDDDGAVRLHNVGDGYLLGGDSASFADGALEQALWLSRIPYEGWMDWNVPSNAAATYTPILEDEPPSFPAVSDILNITGVEDTTSLEQEMPLNFTVAASDGLVLVPVGFPAVELVREPLAFVDTDGDGVQDELDNCVLVSNADQLDTNSDGFGNLCDADLNNDGVINFIDLSLLSSLFLMTDDDADLNGDGVVNFIDVSLLSQQFLQVPGPSGIAP